MDTTDAMHARSITFRMSSCLNTHITQRGTENDV